ncbi:MAG: hypothetical protein HQ567_00620 [Candidatus Nealsonbacteria bacterium]|nr:hypothetical protein [Candidatus Nealsonbacteria bacterium]
MTGTRTEPLKEPLKESRKKRATKKEKKNEPKFDPNTVSLPFDSPPFRQSWLEFCQHRRDIKEPLTKLAVTKLLNECKRLGEPTSIQAIDLSTANRWRGIFPPKSSGDGTPPAPKPMGKPFVQKASDSFPQDGAESGVAG